MSLFLGLIKGTPVDTSQSAVPVLDRSLRPLLGYTIADEGNLCEGLFTPKAIVWRWIRRLYKIQTPKSSIKFCPGATVIYKDRKTELSHKLLEATAQIEQVQMSLQELRVLAPVFLYLFEEPTYVRVRHVKVLMPSIENYQKETCNESTTQIVLPSECT